MCKLNSSNPRITQRAVETCYRSKIRREPDLPARATHDRIADQIAMPFTPVVGLEHRTGRRTEAEPRTTARMSLRIGSPVARRAPALQSMHANLRHARSVQPRIQAKRGFHTGSAASVDRQPSRREGVDRQAPAFLDIPTIEPEDFQNCAVVRQSEFAAPAGLHSQLVREHRRPVVIVRKLSRALCCRQMTSGREQIMCKTYHGREAGVTRAPCLRRVTRCGH